MVFNCAEAQTAEQGLTENVSHVGEQAQRDDVANEIVVGHQEQSTHHRQACRGVLPLEQVLGESREPRRRRAYDEKRITFSLYYA